jgi:hypothetical protein
MMEQGLTAKFAVPYTKQAQGKTPSRLKKKRKKAPDVQEYKSATQQAISRNTEAGDIKIIFLSSQSHQSAVTFAA